jgi:HSP20 family protein
LKHSPDLALVEAPPQALIGVNAFGHVRRQNDTVCETFSREEIAMKVRSMLPSLWSGSKSEVEPFRALHQEIERLFNDFTSDMPMIGRWADNANGRLSLRCDVAETDKTLEVTAELPGVSEKEIDVSLAGDMLTIKAEKKSDKEEKTKDYHLVERSYGTFQRSMQLPFQADPAKIDAKFDKGVLKLVVPKPAEAQAKIQKIDVKTAA